MRRHRQRTEVRYEDGWLYLQSGKKSVAIRVRVEDEAAQAGIVCEEVAVPPGPQARQLASSLLAGVRMDVPASWCLDETHNMQILNHRSFYEETFSADCRSNDALRRALSDMPYEVARCLLSAKPEERLQCFSKDMA